MRLLRYVGLLLVVAWPALGAWEYVRSGPFVVYTDAGSRRAKQFLGDLEQFRHVLGQTIGRDGLETVWPVRVVLFRSPADASKYAPAEPLMAGPEAWYSAQPEKNGLSPAWLKAGTRLLLEVNTGRLPQAMERGLATLFSTIAIDRTRVRLGEPVPEAERDLDWAMVHLLAVSPAYSGKLRVLLRNMQSMPDNDPAYRNAVGRNAEAIAKEAEAYLAAGQFTSTPAFGKSLNADRDFYVEPMEAWESDVLLADLLATDPGRAAEARALYQRHAGKAAADTGLGLLALQAKDREAARAHFEKAVAAPDTGPRAYFELGLLEEDALKSIDLLSQAAAANKKWALPHVESAKRSPTTQGRQQFLAEATRLAPRNAGYWEELARAHAERKQFADAAKAWSAAAAAAETPEERERYLAARVNVESDRADHTLGAREERRRVEREKLEALKQETLARLRAFEQQVNQGDPEAAAASSAPLVELFGGRNPDRTVTGQLEAIECPSSRFVLRVRSEREGEGELRLLVDDPGLLLLEGGDLTFRCGPVNPAPRVSVRYIGEKDATLRTDGEAAMITIRAAPKQ